MAFSNNPIDNGPEVDMEDLMIAWSQVSDLEYAVNFAERELDTARARMKRDSKATGETMKQVIHFIGNNEEDAEVLSVLSDKLFTYKAKLTEAKGELDVLQTKIRIWQTRSANARKVLTVE
jgi:hypothetical protein